MHGWKRKLRGEPHAAVRRAIARVIEVDLLAQTSEHQQVSHVGRSGGRPRAQRLPPLLHAAGAVERPHEVVQRREKDALFVDGGHSHDVTARRPTPLFGPVELGQTVEIIVGGADKQIIERQHLLGRSLELLLPQRLTADKRQRHQAPVHQRHIHAITGQRGGHLDARIQRAAPHGTPVGSAKRHDGADLERRDEPLPVPHEWSREGRVERDGPNRGAGRGLQRHQFVLASHEQQALANGGLGHGRLLDVPRHLTVRQIHSGHVTVAQRDEQPALRVHGGPGRCRQQRAVPQRFQWQQRRGGMLRLGSGHGRDRQHPGHQRRHTAPDGTNHEWTTRYCGARPHHLDIIACIDRGVCTPAVHRHSPL